MFRADLPHNPGDPKVFMSIASIGTCEELVFLDDHGPVPCTHAHAYSLACILCLFVLRCCSVMVTKVSVWPLLLFKPQSESEV